MQTPICRPVELLYVCSSSGHPQNIQYIDNVIFANTFSCLFQTSLTFQMNISSYHEYTFDRIVWTCAAATLHTNNSAPLGCIYLPGHFNAPRFAPRAVHQGQLIILGEKRSLTCNGTVETNRAEDRNLLSHLGSTILTESTNLSRVMTNLQCEIYCRSVCRSHGSAQSNTISCCHGTHFFHVPNIGDLPTS